VYGGLRLAHDMLKWRGLAVNVYLFLIYCTSLSELKTKFMWCQTAGRLGSR
jgi:hypothetical protein